MQMNGAFSENTSEEYTPYNCLYENTKTHEEYNLGAFTE